MSMSTQPCWAPCILIGLFLAVTRCHTLNNLVTRRVQINKTMGSLLIRYLPVFNKKTPCLAYMLKRLIWNIGLWSNQSHGLHWLTKFAIVCFFSTNLTQFAEMLKDRDDPERVFECFSVLSFCCMGALKLSSLYTNRDRWQYLLSQVTLLENEQMHGVSDPHCVEYDTDDENESQFTYIERYTKDFSNTGNILIKLYGSTAAIFVMTPFIEYSLQSDCRVYPHILPGWAPLDAVGFFGYFIDIVFEVVASIYCVSVHVAFDCISIGMMIFVRGQFSLLRQQTENIGGRGKDCTLCVSRDARARSRIRNAHVTHLKLCKVMDELNALLKNILGVYFSVATLTVCSVAIRLNSQNLSSMQLVSLLQYMCGTLTQLFLFCHYGDAVLHESSFGMGEGPFGAAWWGLGPSVRRQLVLLGAGMSRPRRLRAGPFYTLDLPSFVQIVRAAYSYYAVLGKRPRNE